MSDEAKRVEEARRVSDADAIGEALGTEIAESLGMKPDVSDEGELELFKLLLDDNDKLSPKAEKVCREIWGRYDKGGKGYFTEAELDEFCTKCNGQPFSAGEKAEMRKSFDCKDGNLTLNGFLALFSLQSCARPSDTIADFEKFGYDYKLDKVA